MVVFTFMPITSSSTIVFSPAPANTDRCPPFILHEPDKFIQVSSGDRLVLRIHCRACPPPSYVWYRNTIRLSYATEAELVIPKVSAHTAGQYTCAITNDLGSFLAGPYTLQLIRKPSFPELAGKHYKHTTLLLCA